MHIVTAKEMYGIDRYAMEELGLDGKILMENAGRAITEKVVSLVRNEDRILILVGSGNNGGDGFVIARTLLNQGYHVIVVQVVPDSKIKGDAQFHKQLYINFGGSIQQIQSVEKLHVYLNQADVVVDAMLGIGITGKLRPPMDQMVEAVNDSNVLTLAIDIPSGVPANEGITDFNGLQADYTFVVGNPKISAYLSHCASYYGKWEVVKIGLPLITLDHSQRAKVWLDEDVRQSLPTRDKFSHKGCHGKGLIIGGSLEMPGSISMTASAALRSGSGLITVATIKESIPSISSHCAEATYISLQGQQGTITGDQEINLSDYDSIAIGMGMGRKDDTGTFTRNILRKAEVPVLIDADGLYHLKQDLSVLLNRSYPTVLTPHPGEMAMLTDRSVREILTSPFSIARQFSRQYNVYLVLKGTYTIITDPDGNQWVNETGNAGLAKGGSGDVLSGILLSMIMQMDSLQVALSNGCYIHGKSAENLVLHDHSKQDLLATDVIRGLPAVFRTLSE